MKPKVVFLFYHGLSHIIGVLKMARLLAHTGYEIHFAGAEFFRQKVLDHGFQFHGLKSVPFGLGFETWVRTIEKEKHIRWSALRDRISDRLYSERDVELYWMLEEVRPGFVFIDSRQATDFIILYRHLKERKIKVAMIHAMLPADVGPLRPPLNSDVMPHDQNVVRKAILRMRLAQFKKRWKKKILHLGFDDLFLIKRRLKKNQIPAFYVSDTSGLLNFSLKNINELILAPAEFDFPNPTKPSSQHYVGFMTNEVFNDSTDPAFNDIWPRITHLKKQSQNLKLILCSFGTIEPGDSEVVLTFLKKLIEISARKNHILVVGLKAKRQDIAQLAIHGNVYIFNFVPQLETLKQTDLFITHGGLNSIREAVHAEVPMLMYPIHPEFDPIGNAARISYHHLGLRGNAMTDTSDDIESKITELLSNPLYRTSVQKLKQLDLQQYTEERLVQILNSIEPLTV